MESRDWDDSHNEHNLSDQQPLMPGRRAKRRGGSFDAVQQSSHSELPSHRCPPPELEPQQSDSKLAASQDPGGVTWRSCLLGEPLLVATVAGVVLGIGLGLLLKPFRLSPLMITLIGFPGELMLRLLRLLVLPLVSLSMVCGVCSIQQQQGRHAVGRLARLTTLYYVGSTVCAILLGIALVQSIQPGRHAAFQPAAASTSAAACVEASGGETHVNGSGTPPHHPQLSTMEALLNVGREVVPDNIAAAAVDMNILGVITFSLMFGIALAAMGTAAEGVIGTLGVLNGAVGKMVTAALWVSPLGVGSLIAASILKACNLAGTLSALGLWAVTVLAGLAIFALLLLPAALYLVTGRSPLATTAPLAQPLIVAFGTSSSAAALPLAMKGCQDLGCHEATVSFFVPLGTNVNMNGTALYEAITAIFIGQAHGVWLGPAQLVVVGITASLAAVGAPAIPSAGLVTMLVVLQAVNLGEYASDLAAILAVDWLLDRIRTAVNLLSDMYGCVMVDHLLKRGAEGEGEGYEMVEGRGLKLEEGTAPSETMVEEGAGGEEGGLLRRTHHQDVKGGS